MLPVASSEAGSVPVSPRVSIVISTLDRPAELTRTLARLAQIDLASATEIVVVDQSAQPFEPEQWTDRLSIPIRLVHQHSRGLGVSRNAALHATAGADVLLFLDDDVIPDEALVREHVRSYVERFALLGVAGYEELPLERRSSPRRNRLRHVLTRLLLPALRGSRRYRRFLDEDGWPAAIVLPGGIFLCDFAHERPCRVMTPRGCNMSFRREALLAVGGFDEGFSGPRRDETDLALRLLHANPERDIWFNPRARVLHLMSPTGGVREAPGREWYARLFRCEMRFARRHLSPAGRVFCRLRLVAEHFGAVLRHPGLVGCLFEDPSRR